ncbi:homoserine dehydrogenase-domain-containing protein [Irpex lacteus]|nr:homoserine dehydrogenase-domain-containing protein [Irpex lacteus]
MSPQEYKAPLSVAIVGTGLVGSELISQLLSLPSPSPFKLVSLSTTKKSVFAPLGLDITPSTWSTLVQSSTEKPDLLDLADKLELLQRAVLVDNTASQDVAELYPEFLKRAQELYDAILEAAKEGGARWLNESTVGAGLPVVQTLKDMVASGDKIKKIEGVFSGTMSYIFNEFSTASPGGPAFSSVVRVAREKGYTEPHPADDLNGADVARKLAILARSIPSLTTSYPPATPPEFDKEFDEMRESAREEGMVLRADLEKYPTSHPFATSLGGSDNIIMFHTERYSPRPLIVQGAGAGAAVTAMGVMSDLFKLA